jgi:hypothetical protein
VTDEDWALYRKRQLEIHEERGRERQVAADLAFVHAVQAAKKLTRRKRKTT